MIYAETLESYLVPVEEAIEGTKQTVSTPIAIAATTVAFAAMSLPGYFENKKRKQAEKLQKEAYARIKKENEEKREKAHAEWEKDPKTKAAKAYVNKKYGVNLENLDDASEKKLHKKIYDSVKADIITIAKRLNRDKKTLLALAKKASNVDYIESDEANNIKNGICAENPIDYGETKYPQFDIDSGGQAVRDFALYVGYYKAFSIALDAKYKNEIQAKIISKFSVDDRGCICFSFR